jgi:hypothetical protein
MQVTIEAFNLRAAIGHGLALYGAASAPHKPGLVSAIRGTSGENQSTES